MFYDELNKTTTQLVKTISNCYVWRANIKNNFPAFINIGRVTFVLKKSAFYVIKLKSV